MLNDPITGQCVKSVTGWYFGCFCGGKPGIQGLSLHDALPISVLPSTKHIRFDPKIGHGIYKIRWIPRACVECTSMLDKPQITGLPPQQQPKYQPVTDFTHWPVIG